MTSLASKWMITLLAYGVCLGLGQSARAQAQTTPPPPLGSPGQGGQEARDGTEVKGDFVTMLTLVLNLTPDQQTKVKAIFEATRAQAKVITDDPKLSQNDKMMKIEALREATNAKIRPLLTADQQESFDELQKQLLHGTSKPQPAPAP
jgi:Spy/CpxP family protein refolding chaperone